MSKQPIKLKLETVVAAGFFPAFHRLAALNFPDFATNRALARSLGAVKDAVEAFHKTRQAILDEHGTKDGKNVWTIPPENIDLVQSRVDLATEGELALALTAKLKLTKNQILSGADQLALRDVLDLDDEPAKAATAN